MDQKLTDQDYIFDGFAHRKFDPSFDGWRNHMPNVSEYPTVLNAMDTMALFNELRSAKRRIWELEQEVKSLKPLMMQAVSQ